MACCTRSSSYTVAVVAAAPTSRVRRVGLRRPGPFCRSAVEANGRFGSAPGSGRTDQVLADGVRPSPAPPSSRPLDDDAGGRVPPQGDEELEAIVATMVHTALNKIANRLPFGLAAYAYTRSAKTAQAIAAAVETGMISINHHGLALPEVRSAGSRIRATAPRAAPRRSRPISTPSSSPKPVCETIGVRVSARPPVK